MMEMEYQYRSEAKIKWAVNAYREWREMRLDRDDDIDQEILYSDIDEPSMLTRENFELLLCRFIWEVKKSKEEGDYPGRTLYQMATALQNYLKKKNIGWKLVHSDIEFVNFQRVLDKVMQERASLAIGTVRKQAQVISMEFENSLWERNIPGEDNPGKLRGAVLYLLSVNCALRAGDEHYNLHRPGGCTPSQLSFEYNSKNVKCLVYHEDNVTKTNRGGLRDMKKEQKIVWIHPSSNVVRCPVRIVGKYLSLVPSTGSKPHLYLHSLKKPRPQCWYTTNPLGINKVKSVVSDMLKDAGLDGYFTNHSLRRTAATRLFQAGTNVKLIKEVTGHISNAVEKYEITSEQQRENISAIIQGKTVESNEMKEDVKAGDEIKNKSMEFVVKEKAEVKENVSKVEDIVNAVVRGVGEKKARVMIHIDLLE